MTDPAAKPATYLEEAAAILRTALKSAEDRYDNTPAPRKPEHRQELLEARVRVAEGLARLHEADRAGGPETTPGDPRE